MFNLNKNKLITLLKVQYSNMLEYRVEIALWAISGIIPFLISSANILANLEVLLAICKIPAGP